MCDRRRHRLFQGPIKGYRKKQRLRQDRKRPLLLQLMPMCNLRHRRDAYANRQKGPKLLMVAPPPPTVQPKNFTTHRQPHIRHFANDVAARALFVRPAIRKAVPTGRLRTRGDPQLASGMVSPAARRTDAAEIAAGRALSAARRAEVELDPETMQPAPRGGQTMG